MPLTRRPHKRVDTRLYQYTDGQGGYFVRVEGWRPDNTKVRTHKVDCPPGTSLGQAMVMRDELLAAVGDGSYVRGDELASKPRTFREVADAFVESKAGRWSSSTARTHRGIRTRWSDLEDLPLSKISHARHIAPLAERLERDGYSVRYRALVLTRLRAVFAFAMKRGWIDSSPAHGVQLPQASSPMRVLPNVEELTPMFAYWRGLDDEHERIGRYVGVAPLFSLILWGALRQGEARAARWTWVDRDRGSLDLPAIAVKTRQGRAVPLSDDVLQMLDRHRDRLRTGGRPCGDDDFMFPAPKSEKLRSNILTSTWWPPALRAAGLEGLTPHDFRRIGISRMAESAMSEALVRRITGHRSSRMHWHYRGVFRSDLQRAAEMMPPVVTPADGKATEHLYPVGVQAGYNTNTSSTNDTENHDEG